MSPVRGRVRQPSGDAAFRLTAPRGPWRKTRQFGYYPAMLDLVLAVGHHLLIFAIFGVLIGEFLVVRPGLSVSAAGRIAQLDLWYGILAAAIVILGFCRAIFAAKGWAYYSHNVFFWAKIASFAAIGLLSVPPTLEFSRWKKSAS